MNRYKLTALLIAITLFSSCEFNQSVNKDLTTGAYSRGNGIGSDDVLIQINGETDNRNEFFYGEKVNLVFNNVTGLTQLDGKTYPGLSMYIVKNEKDTIYSKSDLLKGAEDGTDLFPLQLQANFRTVMPYQNNESYKVYVEIRDNKGDGKFNYELPFSVRENDFLDINKNGLTYSNIYLWNETLKQPVFKEDINSKHHYILILNDVEGMELTDDKVFPIFSIDIIDNLGNKIISNSNLLSAYENSGVDPKDLKNQVTADFTFTSGLFNNPCVLTATLKDKNSTKEINMSTELIIN